MVFVEDPFKVKITGLTSPFEEDMLAMFFENKRRSGGGDIENIESDPGKGQAFITYVNSEGKFW